MSSEINIWKKKAWCVMKYKRLKLGEKKTKFNGMSARSIDKSYFTHKIAKKKLLLGLNYEKRWSIWVSSDGHTIFSALFQLPTHSILSHVSVVVPMHWAIACISPSLSHTSRDRRRCENVDFAGTTFLCVCETHDHLQIYYAVTVYLH